MKTKTKINDITAVILAGGKNSRIQKEKSLIRIKGDHLIDKQVQLLGNIFENIIIVTSKDELRRKFPDLIIVEDEYKNCGPLGGIHAAMKHASTDSIFVFACDMPNLKTSIILQQVATYRSTTCDILVPRHREGIEPLHAIYSKTNLPFLEKCLVERRYSVRSFYNKVNAGYLNLDAKHIDSFFNINTYADLKKIV
ncbi:MAG: molybdenum cofactor guanylyltransferase [Candidatus Tenebribacter burtonii]|jgi:molybdopterin-guanine dinucleotide biosynthesis protein A|nr:molybdenum cofactor guanylyltransferase [Candidatus Tenebribacter burtonii]